MLFHCCCEYAFHLNDKYIKYDDVDNELHDDDDDDDYDDDDDDDDDDEHVLRKKEQIGTVFAPPPSL